MHFIDPKVNDLSMNVIFFFCLFNQNVITWFSDWFRSGDICRTSPVISSAKKFLTRPHFNRWVNLSLTWHLSNSKPQQSNQFRWTKSSPILHFFFL